MHSGGINGKHALVIEDDPDFAALLTRLLTGLGMSISVAYNGQSALFEMGHRRPDLVTLDIHLPDLWGGGTMVYRKMKLPHSGLRDIPVVVITGLTTGDRMPPLSITPSWRRISCRSRDAYLDKPLAADHITDVVLNVLAR